MTQTTLPSELKHQIKLQVQFTMGNVSLEDALANMENFISHQLHLKDLEKAEAVREAVKYCISVSEMTDEQMDHLEQKYGFSLSEPVLPPPQKGSK